MSKKQVELENKEYESTYRDVPRDTMGRIQYILGRHVNNERMNDDIQKSAISIKRIKRHKVSFVMYKVLKPSARPRANTSTGYVKMYVPHAAENGEWFEDFMRNNDLPHIATPCRIDIIVYEKCPSNFSIKNKILSELGLLKPWFRTGDVDNYAKSVLDMIQHGMLEDDCLCVDSEQHLRYSILPRVEVQIEYMDRYPFELMPKELRAQNVKKATKKKKRKK